MSVWAAARRDPVLLVGGCVLLLYSLFFPFSILPESAQLLVANYGDLVLVGLIMLALQHGLGKVSHLEERDFWNFLTLAFGYRLMVRALHVFWPERLRTTEVEIIIDCLLLLVYLTLFFALEKRPHLSSGWSREDPAHHYESYGAIVLAFGLLAYFILIPIGLNRETYDIQALWLLLYLVLEGFVLSYLLFGVFFCRSLRWSVQYALIAAAILLWLIGHVVQYLRISQVVESAPPTWAAGLSLLAVFAASRLRHLDWREEPSKDRPAARRSRIGPLVIYVLALPVLHLTFYNLSLFDPGSRPAREVLIFLCLFILGVMLLFQQLFLFRSNRTLYSDLRRASERLQESRRMEAIGRLAGSVAHDFNNLLTVIKGNTELLLRRSGDAGRHELESVQAAAGRAGALVAQLLAFGRRQPMHPRALNLNAVLDGVEDMLRRLIGEDIELEMVRAPGPVMIRADAAQLEQVILNLAANARDAMPQGGRLTISTARARVEETGPRDEAMARPGAYAVLTVSDTGVGMDEETRSHIFEPYFTTKDTARGTGLGLATVYGVVKQSGGHIQIASSPGEGTTLKVYLPELDEKSIEPEPPLHEPAARGGGSETILLIEDNDAVREVTRRFLAESGFTVLEASNADEALDLDRKHAGEIHCVVTDVVMPGKNGPEVASQLVQRRPGTKVLCISGYAEDVLTAHLKSGSEWELLPKPYSREQLVGRIRMLLDP